MAERSTTEGNEDKEGWLKEAADRDASKQARQLKRGSLKSRDSSMTLHVVSLLSSLVVSATLGKDHVQICGLPSSGSTNVLYQQLKERELNGDLIVVLADEYLTSQAFSTCNQRDLVKMPSVVGFSVLKCRRWNNIMKNAWSIWSGASIPSIFQRRPSAN